MGIRIVVQQIIAHRLDHHPRDLCAAGAIEIGHLMTIVNARESGEMPPDFRTGNGRGGDLLSSLDHSLASSQLTVSAARVHRKELIDVVVAAVSAAIFPSKAGVLDIWEAG